MIEYINFKNYKSFKDQQNLLVRPLTILIGKNSSGKSALAKLPTLIEGSLSGNFSEALLVENDGVELGAEFRDLVYGRDIGSLEIGLGHKENLLNIEVAIGIKDKDLPQIRKWNLNNTYLTYNDQDHKYYTPSKEKSYLCEFNGFNLISITPKDVINNVPLLRELGLFLQTNYIGPFRQIPNRTHNISGASKLTKIGTKGENAYKLLIRDYLYNNGELLKKVSEWYQNNFDGWGVMVNTTSSPDYKIEIFRDNPKFSINIRDVGEGMSQALPLVISAFIEHPEQTLTIIEQPELHLHPAAHGNLAELFAMATLKKRKFLIETHSQNFVLRIRRLIAEGEIDKDDVIIYSVEYDEENNKSHLKEITIDAYGRVSYWPENVFSETLDEAIAIRNAQINKKGNEN